MNLRKAFAISALVGISFPTAVHAQLAEMPTLGTIDFFGLQIPESEAVELLPFKVGEAMEDVIGRVTDPESKPQGFAEMFGAKHATMQFVCCNADQLTMAYIGLADSDEPTVAFREPPIGEIFLPEDMVRKYNLSMEYLFEAVKNPQGPEDLSQGHSLVSYPPLREIQESFIVEATDSQVLLIRVLHDSIDPEHRFVAAHILGYAADKKAVTPELVFAVTDSNTTVRNNATRAIGVIAAYANMNPQLGIEIEGGVFVDMLNSLNWTDRNKGLMVLNSLSRARNADLLAALRMRALNSLIEMRAWKNLGHAEAACRILVRILGLPEQDELHPRKLTLAHARELEAKQKTKYLIVGAMAATELSVCNWLVS